MTADADGSLDAAGLARVAEARVPQRSCLGSRHWLIALTLFLLAFILRAAFVSDVIRQLDAEEIANLNFDSTQYLQLAGNLAHGGRYADLASPDSRFAALLRTPGYPAFCAIFDRVGCTPRGILWAQAVLGAAMAVLVYFTARALLASQLGGVIAGLASALSPTGIGLSGIVLVDLLFALMFLAGLGLLHRGAARARMFSIVGAAAIFGAGALVKPTLLVWPPVAVLLYFLFARGSGQRLRWGAVAILLLIPPAFMLPWGLRNYRAEGAFTLSTVDAQNLRQYVAVMTEEWAKAGHVPTLDAFVANQSEVRSRYAADFAAGLSPADRARRERAESWTIIRAHPRQAAAVVLRNIKDAVSSDWDYFPRQLPAGGRGLAMLRAWNRLIYGRPMRLASILLVATGLALPLMAGPSDKSARRARLLALLALALTLAYFATFAGTTAGTGSRIMYPAEFAILILTAGGVVGIRERFWPGCALSCHDHRERVVPEST